MCARGVARGGRAGAGRTVVLLLPRLNRRFALLSPGRLLGWLRLLLSAVVVLALPGSALAQAPPPRPAATFDLDKDRELNVSLAGSWRFKTGDDPSWSRPGFDDSSWSLIRADTEWGAQGYKGYTGVAWYRCEITVPAKTPPLAIYIPGVEDSYEVFVDGQLLATQGGLPPSAWPANEHARTIVLPSSANSEKHTLSVAIRVWSRPGSTFAGIRRTIRGRIRIGAADLIHSRSRFYDYGKAFDSASVIFLALLETLAAVTALALFAFRRTEKEFLWFAIALLLSTAAREILVYSRFHLVDDNSVFLIDTVLHRSVDFAQIFFYMRLLGGRRDRLYWGAIGATLAGVLLAVVQASTSLHPELLQNVDILLSLPFGVWLLVLVFRRSWEGVPDGRWLLAPILLQQIVHQGATPIYIGLESGRIQSMPDWFYEPVSWPFSLSIYDIPDALFLLAMLVILIHRFTRTRLHEDSLERERDAARTVQQVLVPEEIPLVPGFEIANAYRPFGEVGGDFFQILPCEGRSHPGSVLIAIGDVSGKGLPAAMTVSLLVGTLRTLVHYSDSPAEILRAMNGRIAGRSSGGFTTCLVLRADLDGTVVIANAGHINPYRDGQELAIDSGLPLGLLGDAEYVESTLRLDEDASLTLVTDGVVEARSKTGELFGFERTRLISGETAAVVAETAQSFGQDDDITVLRLRRLRAKTTPALNAERVGTGWSRSELSSL